MFHELNGILNIGEDADLSGKNVLITESGADGSFILHHFISAYLKQTYKVCLLTLNQSFTHYNTVGNKLGASLTAAKENGELCVIEGLKNLGHQIVSNKSEGRVLVEFNAPQHHALKHLFFEIKKAVDDFKQDGTMPCLIVLDDLSLLLSLGIPESDIWFLIHYINVLCKEESNHVGLVSLIHGYGQDDEGIDQIAKQVEHISDICVKCSGLETGYCKDVHGQLKVTWPLMDQRDVKKMQFKIMDKNILFFALGTSSAVL